MKRISHLDDLAERFDKGTRIVMHSACATPPRLSAQLLELAEERGPFELFDMAPMGSPGYVAGVTAGALKLTSFVPGRPVRRALRAGDVTVMRRPLSEAPMAFRAGEIGMDVLLLQLSVPDADGVMSLGLSCDTMRAALACDPLVIAEINPDMPRTHGDTGVRAEDIDYWLEGGGLPSTVDPAPGDATDSAIADHIAGLLSSGDVLQTGVGSIPDLTATRLTHLHDLGIHTGIITEGLQGLIEKGIVTNAGTREAGGRSVATLAAGSAAFYRFLHDNRAIEFLPCNQTHALARLSRIPQFSAINGALEIDLSGNVNAETADGQRVSAPGGQPDFAKGASLAPGGKSIIALRATSKDGSTSRIVPSFGNDIVPTIDTRIVNYVVTEYGVANVTGLSGIALADALVNIAAPEFRSYLRRG